MEDDFLVETFDCENYFLFGQTSTHSKTDPARGGWLLENTRFSTPVISVVSMSVASSVPMQLPAMRVGAVMPSGGLAHVAHASCSAKGLCVSMAGSRPSCGERASLAEWHFQSGQLPRLGASRASLPNFL